MLQMSDFILKSNRILLKGFKQWTDMIIESFRKESSGSSAGQVQGGGGGGKGEDQR